MNRYIIVAHKPRMFAIYDTETGRISDCSELKADCIKICADKNKIVKAAGKK